MCSIMENLMKLLQSPSKAKGHSIISLYHGYETTRTKGEKLKVKGNLGVAKLVFFSGAGV